MVDEKKKWGGVQDWLNTVLSVADPDIRDFARKLLEGIPSKSPLRSVPAARVIAVLASLVEKAGKKRGPVAELISEKASDMLDFAGSILSDKKAREVKTVSAGVIADEWIKKFISHAGHQLQHAADRKAELERLKEEFAARLTLVKFIEESLKSFMPPKEEATSTEIDWNKLREFLERTKKALSVEPARVSAMKASAQTAFAAQLEELRDRRRVW